VLVRVVVLRPGEDGNNVLAAHGGDDLEPEAPISSVEKEKENLLGRGIGV
jgi:hypothetical protein